MAIRVVLADDNDAVRTVLVEVLTRTGEAQIVGLAADERPRIRRWAS